VSAPCLLAFPRVLDRVVSLDTLGQSKRMPQISIELKK
jgi:hypothetical protein